jgi:hypothetical protein
MSNNADFMDSIFQDVATEVNKPDQEYDKAIDLAIEIMNASDDDIQQKPESFLRHYRLSLLGRDKQGCLFFGDLYDRHDEVNPNKFGVEDFKRLLDAVNDAELWYEFAQYIETEHRDYPEKIRLSSDRCGFECTQALKHAFLLAMPVANILSEAVDDGSEQTPESKIKDEDVMVRNAIRNGLYQLQVIISSAAKSKKTYLYSPGDKNLLGYFQLSISGLIKLIESAKLEDFLREMVMLWTDVKLGRDHTQSNDRGKQFYAYYQVIIKARNWVVHKQIGKIDPADVGFLFLVHARLLREGLVIGWCQNLLSYEEALLEAFEKGGSLEGIGKYNYETYSSKWQMLGEIYINKEKAPDKFSFIKKIFEVSKDNEVWDIHKNNFKENVDNNEFMRVLYRSFFRPDINMNKCPYLKTFYYSFYQRADFSKDIVLKYLGVQV